MTTYWTGEVERVLGRPVEPEEALQWVIDQYDGGKSQDEIGEMLNVTGRSVGRLLRTLGVKTRRKGGDHRSKECTITFDEFHSLTYEELEEKHGMSRTTIWKNCKKFGRKTR